MAAFRIKRNDLRAHYRVQLTATTPDSPNVRVPVDLTDATAVYFIMKAGAVLKVDRGEMDVIDAETGVVEYAWVDGDTDTAGEYVVEIEVMWGSEPQTFPSSGYFKVSISADLA